MSNKSDVNQINSFLKSGEDSYFEKLYDKYKDVVYRRCLSLTSDSHDAEDVFQQIWVKVYFGLPTFKFESSFSTWLFRITTNESINFLKKRRNCFNLDKVINIPNRKEVDTESNIDVTNALNLLSKEERALITLNYIEGYRYKEIADLTGIGVSACKMRIKRAKDKLAIKLK